jgi:hypothetical protein
LLRDAYSRDRGRQEDSSIHSYQITLKAGEEAGG